jgi:hypothetical protein
MEVKLPKKKKITTKDYEQACGLTTVHDLFFKHQVMTVALKLLTILTSYIVPSDLC